MFVPCVSPFSRVQCKCKKSKCLKVKTPLPMPSLPLETTFSLLTTFPLSPHRPPQLYCDCFAVLKYCGPSCACTECRNTEEHEDTRKAAIVATRQRTPTAFTNKVTPTRYPPPPPPRRR